MSNSRQHIIVLEAVYDNSDIQTDYFDRDHTLVKWVIGEPLAGVVTEPRLRKYLAQLPEWLQKYEWTFRKGERYSMSDHPYGQLRVEGAGEGVEWRHCYIGMRGAGENGHSGMGFILQPGWTSDGEKSPPMPQTFEAFKQLVEEKHLEYERGVAERQAFQESPEGKLQRLRGQLRDAEDVTAEIGAQGFHTITPEERAANVASIKAKIAQIDPNAPEVAGEQKPFDVKIGKMLEVLVKASDELLESPDYTIREVYVASRIFVMAQRVALEKVEHNGSAFMASVDATVDRSWEHFRKSIGM